MAGGPQALINGLPYSSSFIEFDDPTVADGYPVILCDPQRFYYIVDGRDMKVTFDESSRELRTAGLVEWQFDRWYDGKVADPTSGVYLKKIA